MFACRKTKDRKLLVSINLTSNGTQDTGVHPLHPNMSRINDHVSLIMAFRVRCNEILLGIVDRLTSDSLAVNLEVGTGAAQLIWTAIVTQHFIAEL